MIQAVALAEFDGLHAPNAYGHLPLEDDDPARPERGLLRSTSTGIVDQVARMRSGLYVGLLPTWGDKWNRSRGAGPEIFTPENAAIYGEWLGRRYKDKPARSGSSAATAPVDNDAQTGDHPGDGPRACARATAART